MINAPESLTIVTTQSKQVSEVATHRRRKAGSRKRASPVGLVCDLAHARAYTRDYERPHAPVLAAFGADRLHECRLSGSWDLNRAISENASALFRSIHLLPHNRPNDALVEWDDLTFQFGPRTFLYADSSRVTGYASTPVEAERLVTWFSKTYSKPPVPSGGVFNLIAEGAIGLQCQTVPLPPDTILSTEAISLHYGSGSGQWHQDYTEKLRERTHGLSIFEGAPGTGKTFYLRHLMGVLKESHRFYFIPTSAMGILSKPKFVDFWTEERRFNSNQKFVIILEDSDAALMTRGSDNREEVSAILNLSDGMLADFLRLQIICTINCTAADIDQALLRPGRLLCHRVFGRLDYPQAVRLAESLGRTLPVVREYSLAEVFAGHGTNELDRPQIGFATQPDKLTT